jgi:hypothetical protein
VIWWDVDDRQWMDDETGRAATAVAIMAARDRVADDYAAAFRQLAILYTSGQITLEQWRLQFEALVIEAVGQGYWFGRGGIELMEGDDWERVARQAKSQLEYANGFAADVAARIAATILILQADAEATTVPVEGDPAIDPLPSAPAIDATQAEQQARAQIEPAMAARSELYSGATIVAFEEGQAAAHSAGRGVLILPVYPADNGTECRSRCRCGWHITGDESAQVWRCTWVTAGDRGVCDGCRDRGRRYANLIVHYDGSPARVE